MAKPQAKGRQQRGIRVRLLPGRRAVAPAAVLALALAVVPAAAQDDQGAKEQLDSAGKLALEAANKMVRALELFIDDLPQYEPPEVMPNGDIILRRVNPPGDDSMDSDSRDLEGTEQREALVPEKPEGQGSGPDSGAREAPRSNRTPDGDKGGDGDEGERRI
ncbi:hypothetical protein ACFOGJ_06965 [Marinibaculum pumilum]|uniref:Uncharacterized protein n=1 Tax=Marinibaculum pumilum TaxID=1766165 RepID=A0ABV7KXC3_9PROT